MPKRRTTRPRREAHPPFAPQPLEPRTLLAAIAWDGEGLDGDWHNPLNWDGDIVPAEGDDVTIGPATGPAVFIGEAESARIASLDLGQTLEVSGVLDITDAAYLAGSASFRVLSTATVSTDALVIEAGDGLVSAAGQWTATGPSLIDRSVTIAGTFRIEGRTTWTGGMLILEGAASVLWIHDGSVLSASLDPGESNAITGEGTLHVLGRFEAIWSPQNLTHPDPGELLCEANLDTDGRVRVVRGTLRFAGDIAQVVIEGSVPYPQNGPNPSESSLRLTDGVWEAGPDGALVLGRQVSWNSAVILLRARGAIKDLALHAAPGGALYNDRFIIFYGPGRNLLEIPGSATRIYNRGFIRNLGNGVRTLGGDVHNQPGGRIEVGEGGLLLRNDLDNQGTIHIALERRSLSHVRLEVRGSFSQTEQPGHPAASLILRARDRGQPFTFPDLLVRGHASISGEVVLIALDTPPGATGPVRWYFLKAAGGVTGKFATHSVLIEGQAGRLVYRDLRVAAVSGS